MSDLADSKNAYLPEVGTKVEFIRNTFLEYRDTVPADGTVMVVVAHYHNAAVCCWSDIESCHAETFTGPSLYAVGTWQESQLNKMREEVCDQIYGAMCKAERTENRSDMAEAVYDAIASGKIPHITLS